MTVLDLITDVLGLIGELEPGETPNDSEKADALAALNQLLASWSTEQLNLYTQSEMEVAQTGVASYNLQTRPVLIRSASFVTADGIQFPVQIQNEAQWRQILEPDQTGKVVQRIYCDYGYPTATVKAHPLVYGGRLKLGVWTVLAPFNAVTDTINLPPGYERALKYALALEIAADYGRELPASVLALAQQAKDAIRTLNAQYLAGANVVDSPPPPPPPAPTQ